MCFNKFARKVEKKFIDERELADIALLDLSKCMIQQELITAKLAGLRSEEIWESRTNSLAGSKWLNLRPL